MHLKVKLIDPTLPMPEYKTKGAAAFDLYSRVEIEVPPFAPVIIPSNFIVKIPKGYFLMLAARSSLPKTGLMLANGIGVIDEDFCGEDDEIGLFMINLTKNPVKVDKGQRLAQGILTKIAKAEKFVHTRKMSKRSRGGFGTTGKK